jgi:hypothetical protein
MFYISHPVISVVFDDPKNILSGANLEAPNPPISSQQVFELFRNCVIFDKYSYMHQSTK